MLNIWTFDVLEYLKVASATSEFWIQVFIFATGLGGQALIAKKKISGFYLWFFGNIAVIMTTFPKGMYGMALLYFIYIGFNLYSIKEWKKDESPRHPENPSQIPSESTVRI